MFLEEELSDAPKPYALVYPSRSGKGPGHAVVRLDTEPPSVICSCPAARSLATRPQGCWASIAARRVMGLPAI